MAERLGLGSSLDAWLRDRGEALCLGETWRALLTPALTKACSFVGESTDALSVRLDIAANGELTDWEFSLSTIRPVAAISSPSIWPRWPTANPRPEPSRLR